MPGRTIAALTKRVVNAIRNNTMRGAAAGSPGTLPTNWTTAWAGITRTVVGTGVENGVEYIDIRFNGTTSDAGGGNVNAEGTGTNTAALSGELWTQSAYLSLVAGSLTNVINVKFLFIERNSGGAGVQFDSSSSLLSSISSVAARYQSTARLSGGTSIVAVSPRVQIDASSGVAIDLTLRIGLPQFEKARKASKVKRTG